MTLEQGFSYLTIPVRPSLKSLYPLISIDDYISWKLEYGQPFDPWLRVHVKCDGKIVTTCHRAMYIPGTVKEWEAWTGLSFMQSGRYVVSGALNPITIDLAEDKGQYVEPNVSLVHKEWE